MCVIFVTIHIPCNWPFLTAYEAGESTIPIKDPGLTPNEPWTTISAFLEFNQDESAALYKGAS